MRIQRNFLLNMGRPTAEWYVSELQRPSYSEPPVSGWSQIAGVTSPFHL
jgi:hypothetical protein